MSRVRLQVEPVARGLDRFETLWNRLADGEAIPQARIVSFADLPLLLKTLTPARWVVLEALREDGPSSVYALARRLRRNYKNVHGDAKRLLELGLLERRDDGRLAVGWDSLQAEFRLPAATASRTS